MIIMVKESDVKNRGNLAALWGVAGTSEGYCWIPISESSAGARYMALESTSTRVYGPLGITAIDAFGPNLLSAR